MNDCGAKMITVTSETFRLAQTFTLSRGSKTEAHVLTVRVTIGGVSGMGECVPYARYGESPLSVAAQIESLSQDVTRDALQSLLPPWAARNAGDCALWDLAAKASGRRVWRMAGLAAPAALTTAFTLSLDTPENMRMAAQAQAARPILKIKLGTPDDMPRLEAVRAGAPAARIIIDANAGWTRALGRGEADLRTDGELVHCARGGCQGVAGGLGRRDRFHHLESVTTRPSTCGMHRQA